MKKIINPLEYDRVFNLGRKEREKEIIEILINYFGSKEEIKTLIKLIENKQ